MNRQELTDSSTFINYTPFGAMTHDAVEFGALDFRTAFFIQEKPSRLNLLRDTFHVEIRSNLLVADGVALIPLLIQFDRNPILTYQDWLNFHESDIVKRCFEYLTIQESLYFSFFTGDSLLDTFTTTNNIQLVFKDYIRHIRDMVPWSSADFERLKLNLLRKHPSTLSLWDWLKRSGEGK